MNRTKFYALLIFFLLNGLLIKAQKPTHIEGTILQPEVTSVQLRIDRLHLNKKVELLTSAVNFGKFQFSFDIDQPRTVELVAGPNHYQLYFEPGDVLQVRINDSSISFQGLRVAENNTLQNLYSRFAVDFNDSLMQEKMLSMGVDAFENMIFENRNKQINLFKNDVDKANCSAVFSDWMQHTINYRYWNLLLSYPIINANSNAKILTVNALPKIMLDDFNKTKVTNEAAIHCESYLQFLKYYVIYFTSEKNGFNKFTDNSMSADRKFTLAKERLTGAAFKFWLAQFMVEECGKLSPFIIKKFFTELKETDKEGIYLTAVTEVCGERMAMKEDKKKEEKKEVKVATKKEDELDLTDVDGKHVSLTDFEGKVVYIDFWASWCGPCRGMMPHSKQIHAQLNDKQKKKIVFLYISIDADPTSWKKGIKDLKIEGINVISPGNWTSKVCAHFQINSIPRYMIMNKKGEIVDFNAPRPADSSVLDKLLRYAEE